MKDIILKTENLCYRYGKGTPYETVALDHIDLEIEKGELVGIIGHTGSGKSTLVQHFNGLLAPDSGRVLLGGKDIHTDKATLRAARFRVGVCFQYPEYQLFEETVYKDVAFGPKNMGLDGQEIDRRVREAIRFVGLEESCLEQSVFDLSGGQRRRAAIAGVMAMRPEVLVLDEPCAGLDPEGRDRLLRLIRDYRDATDSTVLFVSHSMDDIAHIASKVIVIHNASLETVGSVQDIFKNAARLKQIGLDVPSVTEIFLKLREKGVDVPTDVYSTADAVRILALYAKGGDKA